jgi:exodeoxyribonuclease V alpha subunit
MSYESAPSTRLLATHCAACGRALRDAPSVDAGLGPECRQKYGATDDSPSPDWNTARTRLGDEVYAAIPALAGVWGVSSQRAANTLTERVAAQPNTPLARRCIHAIRSLGYDRLASRLQDRMRRVEGQEAAGDKSVTVVGRVIRMFHTSPKFSAGKLVIETVEGAEPPPHPYGRRDYLDRGDELSFAGQAAAAAGDRVTFHGTWQRHERFGLQLSVESGEVDREIDREGLALYLAASPAFKGIGPAKAQIIAREFGGPDFEQVLTERPEVIASAAKLPLEVITTLRDEWIKNRRTSIIMTRLAALGLTNRQCELMVEEFGDEAPAILETAPYSVIGRISGLGFARVDEMARRMGVPRDDPERIDAGIIAVVQKALDNGGHTWIEYRELLSEAVKLLALDSDDADDVVESSLDDLISKHKLHCQDTPAGLAVALTRIFNMEDELADYMRADPNVHLSGVDVAAEIRAADAALSPSQVEAGVQAARSTRIVITGPAGSGKTRLIRAITRLYTNHGKRVVHAAPTGKAAKRIEEALALEGDCPKWGTFTLHRLLGYDGRTWRADRTPVVGRKEHGGVGDDEEHDQDGPPTIELADVIIVDEVSMVDITLAWQLFRVLRPSQAVIMVGDHNQLPPVGPGNLLRDLINWAPLPVVRLTEVHRQAGSLLANCSAVLDGVVPPSAEKDPATNRSPWTVVGRYRDPGQVVEAVAGLYSTVLEQRMGFHLRNDVQLLTPTWKGPIGGHALNARIQQIIQRRLFNVEVPHTPPDKRPPFFRGDRIIQLENDYDIGVMNGTIGVVVDPSPDADDDEVRDAKKAGKKPILCMFHGDGGRKKIADASSISLAYALSIHKAQGDQFPCVITIVHYAHSHQHHRNLLYTAVTRAQQVAIILGDTTGIENCARKVETERRRTFLSIMEMAGEAGRRGASESIARDLNLA